MEVEVCNWWLVVLQRRPFLGFFCTLNFTYTPRKEPSHVTHNDGRKGMDRKRSREQEDLSLSAAVAEERKQIQFVRTFEHVDGNWPSLVNLSLLGELSSLQTCHPYLV